VNEKAAATEEEAAATTINEVKESEGKEAMRMQALPVTPLGEDAKTKTKTKVASDVDTPPGHVDAVDATDLSDKIRQEVIDRVDWMGTTPEVTVTMELVTMPPQRAEASLGATKLRGPPWTEGVFDGTQGGSCNSLDSCLPSTAQERFHMFDAGCDFYGRHLKHTLSNTWFESWDLFLDGSKIARRLMSKNPPNDVYAVTISVATDLTTVVSSEGAIMVPSSDTGRAAGAGSYKCNLDAFESLSQDVRLALIPAVTDDAWAPWLMKHWGITDGLEPGCYTGDPTTGEEWERLEEGDECAAPTAGSNQICACIGCDATDTECQCHMLAQIAAWHGKLYMGDQFYVKVSKKASGSDERLVSSTVESRDGGTIDETWWWLNLLGLPSAGHFQLNGVTYGEDGKLGWGGLLTPACTKMTLKSFKWDPDSLLEMSPEQDYVQDMVSHSRVFDQSGYGFESLNEEHPAQEEDDGSGNESDYKAKPLLSWDDPNRYCTGIHFSFFSKVDQAVRAAVSAFRFELAAKVIPEMFAEQERRRQQSASRMLLAQDDLSASAISPPSRQSRRLLYDASSLPACPNVADGTLYAGANTATDSTMSCTQCLNGVAHVRHCECTASGDIGCCEKDSDIKLGKCTRAQKHTFFILMQSADGDFSADVINSMNATYTDYVASRTASMGL
jgi:hypothetical protein